MGHRSRVRDDYITSDKKVLDVTTGYRLTASSENPCDQDISLHGKFSCTSLLIS